MLEDDTGSVGILEEHQTPRPRYAAHRMAAARAFKAVKPHMLIQRAHSEGQALRRARSEEREALPKES